MKKLCVAAMIVLLWCSVSNAAMTCDRTNYVSRGHGNNAIYTITCTFDTTPGTAAYTLTSAEMRPMSGAWVTLVSARPGGTAPDAASVAMTDSKSADLMTAAGNGANLIHATDTQSTYMEGPSGDHYRVIDQDNPITITVTDQATNNAIVLFDFELAR